jgi:hypothetical protein
MDQDHHHAKPGIPEGAETAKDPVCGMTVAVKPDGRHAAFEARPFTSAPKNARRSSRRIRGSTPRAAPPVAGSRSHCSDEKAADKGRKILVSTVRLFALFGMPRYHVIAGYEPRP